jgi:hypothetical protein
MLQKLAEHIEAAKQKSAEAEGRAARASSDSDRTNQLELAKAWRHVASSYEFVLSMEKFLIDAHHSEWPFKAEDIPKPPSLNDKH